MNRSWIRLRTAVSALLLTLAPALTAQEKPLKALLICGGCCHDYKTQQETLSKGIMARANIQVDVIWTDDQSTNPYLPVYEKDNWFEGYDLIIHDECAADEKDGKVLARVLEAHKTLPAVHLHCAMHSFRTGGDEWFKHLGLQSTGHGPQEPISIKFADPAHPVLQGLTEWTTGKEELYNNVNVFGAQPIAMGHQLVNRDGKQVEDQSILVWSNEINGVKSFSTTLGHNNETVADDRYLTLLARGALWASGKLDDAHLKPYTGENKVTFVSKDSRPGKQPAGKAPEGATLVTVSASSEETGRGNLIWQAFDGDKDTRWCANGPGYPQWIQFEFAEPVKIDSLGIVWENQSGLYPHTVEASTDGKAWTKLAEATDSAAAGDSAHTFPAADVKFVKITVNSSKSGGWASIREITAKGPNLKSIYPRLSADQAAAAAENSSELKNKGNIVPRIEPLSAEREAQILKDVKLADGFEATVFAAPPAVNYPVFVAAATDGTLYVSSDGNGSLGRNPERGRVIRLRETDGDGKADETKVFCEINAPRGLVWDKDRLYLVHPPHLSVFIDKDGDGVSDEQKILVKNLAFDYDQRPADHTTNGLSTGADGYLYIAVGDFGFMKAEGTDGRTLQMRGGGVARVRPDGSGLELYASGTRNILEVAIAPDMEMFTRDNTNDGGGWDVRFHHISGGEDHGYPRLYKNFNDEIIQPLADYGGGSGCGAVYIDEPGYPAEWNKAPYTVDWGTSGVFHHSVKAKSASYEETEKPRPIVSMTRPTDADVDGNSALYAASWHGATFDWAGPNVGYIVRITPKGFTPDKLPDIEKLEDKELTQVLNSPSYRRRLAAQWELIRRKNPAAEQFLEKSLAPRTAERKLAASVFTGGPDSDVIRSLGSADPVLAHIAVNAAAARNLASQCFELVDEKAASSKMALRALAKIHTPEVVQGLIARIEKATDPALKKGILSTLCRLHFVDGEWTGDSWGTRPDTRGPYYQPEAWAETPLIAKTLSAELEKAGPDEASFLVEEMRKNRIQSRDTLLQLIELASKDAKMIPEAVEQIAAQETIPEEALSLLTRAISEKDVPALSLAKSVDALNRTDSAEVVAASIKALDRLDSMGASAQSARDAAAKSFLSAPNLENRHSEIETLASQPNPGSHWVEAALLALADRKTGSPESRQITGKKVDELWENPDHKLRLIDAAAKAGIHSLDEKIVAETSNTDARIATAAKQAAETLKIDLTPDETPKLATLSPEDALKQIIETKGNVNLGKRIFEKATCVACHTTTQSEAQKGPYLGNIAQTYPRADLAANILNPNLTIAQGFATNIVTLKDGKFIMGFVTNESGDSVVLRDIAAQEHKVSKADIAKRETNPASMMPPGLMSNFTVRETASLLDYLEALSAEKK